MTPWVPNTITFRYYCKKCNGFKKHDCFGDCVTCGGDLISYTSAQETLELA